MEISRAENYYDIIIIGGSAAGMSAAFSSACAAETLGQMPKIALLEKNKFLGKKLLATGNGRCNIDNINSPYHKDVGKLCKGIGLFLSEPDAQGRIYPYTRQAKTVCDGFSRALDRHNISIFTATEVLAVEIGKDGEFITTIQTIDYIKKGKGENERFVAVRSEPTKQSSVPQKKLVSKKLILATGGKAGSVYGNTGEGLDIARSLGHSINKLQPALCPLSYADISRKRFSSLSGLRAVARVSIYSKQKELLHTEIGEVQFREDSISGICVFNASNFYENGSFLVLDLFPNIEKKEILEFLSHESQGGSHGGTHSLDGVLDKRICDLLYRAIGSQKAYEELIDLVKYLRVDIKGLSPWTEAQVSKGGVPLGEIDETNFSSKIVPNLYLAGEILDYAGLSGGYNLSFAIGSGVLAGGGGD